MNSLQAESEPNTFVSYMRFKNINHIRDADKTVSFQVELKNGEIRKLDFPFEVSLPLPPATTPKPVIVVSEPLDVSGKLVRECTKEDLTKNFAIFCVHFLISQLG